MEQDDRILGNESQLIWGIFKQAVVDILNCPSANPDPKMNYRIDSARYDSADAKRFLNKENPSFQYYCGLVDLDPEYAENKFLKYIQKETLMPTGNYAVQKLSV